MRPGLLLLIQAIGLLLLGGIPAVLNFMDAQGFPYPLPTGLFGSHPFVMIYGFFLLLIGNELLVALSREWRGEVAPSWIILTFDIIVLVANALDMLNVPLSFYLVIAAMVLLANYSKVYLSTSKIGLKPTVYNYMLFSTLIISSIVASFQSVFSLPWLGLTFPALTIFAIMSRDLGLVLGGRVINQDEMLLAYFSLFLGIVSFGSLFSQVLIFIAWALSLHASKIPFSKGRPYSKVALTIAWLWLLASAPLQLNYDAFIHSIALGFLFNTVFGVDSVLIDMLIGVVGKRVTLRPSPIPLILLNLGLIMRVAFDLGLNSPIFYLSAPLQGVGILSFYVLTFRQVLPQVRKVDKERPLMFKDERADRG
ncbi:MAG: nitric oxide response protein [Metallosphaera sp.]